MLKWKEGVSFDDLDGEGVIVDLNTGRYISLNRTATAIVQSLATKEPSDAIEQLLSHFDVDRDKLQQDVTRIVSTLHQLHLLEGDLPTTP